MGKTIKHHITKLPNKVRNLVTDNVYTLEITQMNKDLWRVEYTNHSIKETTFLTFGDTKEEAIDKMIAYMDKDANWAIDQFKQKEAKMSNIKNLMNDLKVTLKCGCEVDFTTKLDEPIQFVGTFERLLVCWQSTNEDVREVAFEEIQKRAIEYAHKALAGYNMRARMADEAVKLLIVKLVDKLAEE